MSIHRLFTFNTQQRVQASLEDPEGAAIFTTGKKCFSSVFSVVAIEFSSP